MEEEHGEKEPRTKKHRGRFQAQGDGLEESETWAQDEPLSKEDGLYLLEELKNKLQEKEQNKRKKAFNDAKRFVNNAEGIVSLLKKSFYEKKGSDIRVDIEVLAGIAFVSFLSFMIFRYVI